MRDSMDRREGKKIRFCVEEAKKLLTDLPTVMVVEILSWLPLKSIFKCRCVCKTWLQIISNPLFAKLHLSRSPISILIHEKVPKREAGYLRLYQVVEALDSGFIQIEETIFTPRLNLPDSSFILVDSCNGLVLLCGIEMKLVCVCNPVLDEFITIKVPQEDKRTFNAFFCFGFSVKTNQYKVVQTFYVYGEGSKAELYTVGTGSWKSLGNAPYCSNLGYTRFNTFLHGACHWVEYLNFNLNDQKIKIVCFDFENDMFRDLPSPPQFKPEKDDLLMLGVIEDSLCACCFREDSYQFDIWVMKDYGVKESWTMQFRIEDTFFPYSRGDYYCPLILLKNGRMLMSCSDEEVICYNLKENRLMVTDIYAKGDRFSIIAYTPCFVSLKDVAIVEQISR
ncbi:hypothetical protein COLO4_20224 [Corchorus olitorius]|uniref:F-box domain-containing protein n=1 Tax=Corchorus olitorius TaxID=93759 RepID=A0A1R3J173_9ROSI|nr:hypothetical protein COLO4_20224 [Corchorus olitorius]